MYILSVPLLFISLLLYFFPGSYVVFLLVILISSTIAIFSLIMMVLKPHFFRFTNMMAISLLAGYAFTTLIYLVSQWGPISAYDYDVTGIVVTQKELSSAVILVNYVCAALFAVSRFEPPINIIKGSVLVFSDIRASVLLWTGFTLVLFAFIFKGLGYGGIQVDDAGRISPLGSISYFVAPLLPPLFGIKVTQSQKTTRFIDTLGLIVTLIFLFPLGRRVLLYSVVVTIIMSLIYSSNEGEYNRRLIIQNIILQTIFVFIVSVGFIVFYGLRISLSSTGDESSLQSVLGSAMEIGQFNSEEFRLGLSENVITRPFFLLNYLSILVSAHHIYPPLWGLEALHAIKTSLPSLLFPAKSALPQLVEEVSHPLLGLDVYDGSNTIITAALNEFGVYGVFIYPVILAILYSRILLVLHGRLPYFVTILIAIALVYRIFCLEASLADFLTVGLRDLLLIVIVCIIFWRALNIKHLSSAMKKSV